MKRDDGSSNMTGDLQLSQNRIKGLPTTTQSGDEATSKFYVLTLMNSLSNVFLDRAGSIAMTGDLNMRYNRINNLNNNPQTGTDVVNKNYVDTAIQKSHIKPSHKTNQFDYLMKNTLEWSDLIPGGNSFNLVKISDLSPDEGNFYSYNHKVVYTTIMKNAQSGYKYKMGNQCFPLTRKSVSVKRRLRTRGKMQTGCKMQTESKTQAGCKMKNKDCRLF